MARLASTSDGGGSYQVPKSYRYYVTILFDGFGTNADLTVMAAIFTLTAHLPVKYCLLAVLFAQEETRRFKSIHDLKGRAGPLVFITEEDPFTGTAVKQRALLELGRLKDSDDIKKVLATVAEQAYDEDFLKRAQKGELIRRVQQSIGKYGDTIASALSIIGLG